MLYRITRQVENLKAEGFTNYDGIIFLSQNTKYPRLIEEEERWHGVFLGHSASGLLQCVFDTIELGESHNEVLLNRLFTKNAFNQQINQKAAERFAYYSLRILDDSIILHESISKYLAFLMAGIYYNKSSYIEIDHLFKECCDQFPDLQFIRLIELLGHPLSSENANFNKNFLHIVAKVLLSSPELAFLSQIKDRELLSEKILKGDFWSAYNPNSAFKTLLQIIDSKDIATIKESFKRFVNLSRNKLYGYWEFEKDLYELLNQKLLVNGFTISSYFTRHELIKMACLLSINIRYSYFFISKFFAKNQFSFTVDKNGVFDVEFPSISTPKHFTFDKACETFYPARTFGKKISTQSNKKIVEILQKKMPNLVLCIPIPDTESKKIKLYFYLVEMIFTAHPNGSVQFNISSDIFLTKASELAALSEIIKSVPLIHFGFIFIAPFDKNFQSIRMWLSNLFNKYGSVVFLDQWCLFSKVMYADYISFPEYSLSPSAQGYVDRETQTYKALIQLFTYREYATVSCVPFYFEDLFYKSISDETNRIPRIFNNLIGEKGKSGRPLVNLELTARAVFNACYLYDIITPEIFDLKEANLWMFQDSSD